MESQLGTGSCRDGPSRRGHPIQNMAEALVAAGLAAHSSVVGLIVFSGSPPLLTALVASVVFAGVSLSYGRRAGAAIGATSGRLVDALGDLVVLVVIGAGGWLIGRALGTGAAFYCEPLVPWRIEIALSGSFGVAYVTGVARQRRRGWMAYPVAVLALLWIAPFYGYFSAPLFVGISLNAMCPGRPIVTVVLAALGMRVGEQVGLATANWLSGTVPPRGDA